MEFVKVTPSLPQRERQHAGAIPLDPHFAIFTHKSPASFMLHGARVDETPSARGFIAIEFRRVVNISHEKRIIRKLIMGVETPIPPITIPAATPAGRACGGLNSVSYHTR
ncbi:MAG: hypothetical protein CVV32_09835 [Methanomicrobiales archaeon HGW-Methanomicrobiales-3]|nr:MAG: hypothetical protein CVV32_09835 [Methanomicrobiales archaeon HGW-Methanomicrobiales-3]